MRCIGRRSVLVLFLMAVARDAAALSSEGVALVAPEEALRAALIASNPVLVTRGTEGAPRGGVTVELVQALARHLGLPLKLLPYDNPARYNESIGGGEWDVGLAARDPSREAVLAFTRPFMEVDGGYVARHGFHLRQASEADREGVRIAVAEGSAPDAFLTRSLRQAVLVRIPGGQAAAHAALTEGRADLYADNLHICHRIAEAVPGASVLEGRFNTVRMAVAVPKVKAAVVPTLDRFIEAAVRDGLVAAAIDRAGLRGVRPAQAA
jgi:polar amino acid transport system substrate-binding protein